MSSSPKESEAPFSLTEHLLTSNEDGYKAATQAPFLAAAAEGRLPKSTLGLWLADDMLYVRMYIKAAKRMLDNVTGLPEQHPGASSGARPRPETELADWISETLVALGREGEMFLDVARRYGLDLGAEATSSSSDARGADAGASYLHSPGLALFSDLFTAVGADLSKDSSPPGGPISTAAAAGMGALPWLEGAVVLWGTERVYLDAWSWAKARQQLKVLEKTSLEDDEDGGAARKEFIPNWSSAEFAAFVDRLGRLLDRAVVEVLDGMRAADREEVQQLISQRALEMWGRLLAAETAFWPEM